jgi:hypothetical protein
MAINIQQDTTPPTLEYPPPARHQGRGRGQLSVAQCYNLSCLPKFPPTLHRAACLATTTTTIPTRRTQAMTKTFCDELIRPSLFTLYLLFHSSIIFSFYVFMIGILIMQIWNFASRRRLMLQSPLDLFKLSYRDNSLHSLLQFHNLHHPLCTAITQLNYYCYLSYARHTDTA